MTTTSEKETSVDTQGIDITNSAQEYLAELLEKQNVEGIAVRIFITQPGTPYAETCLAYCRPGEEEPTDVLLELEKINVFLDKNSLAFLEEAVVDFNADRMGGQLTIKAPNAKMPKVNADSPLEDRINYVLYSEARGLDIPKLPAVLNFDMPEQLEDYVHRIGRTGRAGNKGLAISFFTPSKDCGHAKGLIDLLSKANQEIPHGLTKALSMTPPEKVHYGGRKSGGGGGKGKGKGGGWGGQRW